MALIAKSNKHIVLCAHREIIIYNIEQKTYSRSLVPTITKLEKNGKTVESKNDPESENDDENETKLTNKNAIVAGQINNLAISSCGSIIAVTTFGDKLLHIYRLDTAANSLELLSRRELVRGCSAMRFSSDSGTLLLADKTGDCYVFDCNPNSEAPGKWILGHFSMILDILMTNDSKYIITCDRDEKIRVTRNRQTEVIETYCLGHLEFVSSIECIRTVTQAPILLSISGDKTLRLWNYVDGQELHRYELPAPGLKIAINCENHVSVVLLEKPFKIAIYELIQTDNDIKIHKIAEHTLNEEIKYINSLIYETDDRLLVSCHSETDEIILKKLELKTDGSQIVCTESTPEYLSEILKGNLSSKKIDLLEDVSILFKKKFDNLKDYHEKKKRRIEEKLSK